MSGRIDLDEALKMWLAGYRYRAIAERFGVSRQAIEQTRNKYPEFFPPRDWTSVTQAGSAVQVAYDTVARWVADGLLPTSPDGLVRVVDVEGVIAELWTRQCEYPDCDHEIEDIWARRRYCPEHTIEVQRYNYPVMSPEARLRFRGAQERWQVKNPEARHEIQLRAQRAYKARQREKVHQQNAAAR